MSGATGAAGGGADAGGRPGSGAQTSAGGTTAGEGARGPAGDSAPASVTETRKLRPQRDPHPKPQYSSPLPNERPAPAQPAQPYHPPQAYAPPPGGGAGQGGSAVPGQPGQAAHSGHQQAATAVRRPRTPAGARPAPRTRKARLRVARVDPWSVMKVSFLLAIALGICTVIAVAVLWMVMDAMGVFSAVGGTISDATESQEGSGFDLESFLSLPRVLGFTGIIAVINVVLATALATLGAFIYNLSAGFVGGVELTLAEDE
ncbi:hypothetical protein GCM10017744_052740 [Streptomyces antimycoticus]|uniref:DUF3566 domain-containing protein n=2 Tax=Streptomyces violaceusniger group TaxID=2839105 RepID=A0A4D4KCL3_9ACTN|nr:MULTISPECIES: DUF3566 domain-containing protein [Streptomyces]BBJ42386.1 hypothetical protein SSPO_051040 [Streptomyces antimycoticus]GDY44067.1 hypothetical protein SANT12839_049490 [Streptomyces antimycoticus]SEC24695.1 Transmembrane protein of unknown function [Streptomyces melanosporofaciens]